MLIAVSISALGWMIIAPSSVNRQLEEEKVFEVVFWEHLKNWTATRTNLTISGANVPDAIMERLGDIARPIETGTLVTVSEPDYLTRDFTTGEKVIKCDIKSIEWVGPWTVHVEWLISDGFMGSTWGTYVLKKRMREWILTDKINVMVS